MKLWTDTKFLGYIGILLLLVGTSAYYYYKPDFINETDLVIVEGTIAEKPYHYTHIDNPDYISIDLKEFNKSFKIKRCGLAAFSNSTILNLDTLETIKFKVSRISLNENKIPLVDSSVEVFGIQLSDNREILTPKMFNKCSKRTWKKFLVFIPFVVLAIILKLFFRK